MENRPKQHKSFGKNKNRRADRHQRSNLLHKWR